MSRYLSDRAAQTCDATNLSDCACQAVSTPAMDVVIALENWSQGCEEPKDRLAGPNRGWYEKWLKSKGTLEYSAMRKLSEVCYGLLRKNKKDAKCRGIPKSFPTSLRPRIVAALGGVNSKYLVPSEASL